MGSRAQMTRAARDASGGGDVTARGLAEFHGPGSETMGNERDYSQFLATRNVEIMKYYYLRSVLPQGTRNGRFATRIATSARSCRSSIAVSARPLPLAPST